MSFTSWLFGAAAALYAATTALGQATEPVANEPISAATDDALADRVVRAAAMARRQQQSIESAHLQFRRTVMVGPFKAGLDPDRCDALLEAHDLVAEPDSLRGLMRDLLATEDVAAEPWSEMELHTLRPTTIRECVREARARGDGEPDVHVVTPEVSLRWDESNSQLNVDAADENRVAYSRLADFWRPAPANIAGADAQAEQVDGRAALRVTSAESAATTLVDETTGFLLRLDAKRGDQVECVRWLGWQTTPAGIPFPTAIVRLSFTDGQLRLVDVRIVHEARFNIPLAPTVFQLGAPAGSVIVDNRRGGARVVRINRDVFDASSPEQVTIATAPLDEDFTPTELAAFEELRRIYVLADGEAIKRFGPPFPLSRKYLPRMLSPRAAATRRKFRYDVLDWHEGALDSRTFYSGITPTTSHLVGLLLKQPATDVEIPAAVLERELPGDYLVRPGASEEELAAGISEILSQELQRPVRLVFREANRRIFVARGQLKINASLTTLRDGRPQIAVNGGDHSGDHGEIISFGRSDELLREVGDYIGHKIVDETTPSELDLAWSKRWYDLDSTPAEMRFKLDPMEAVKLVAAQTGLTIEPDVQRVRVLRLLDR